MAYEVVKTIAGREYRYRVQSERDPQTGKTRNRWTYLGRNAGGPNAAKAARSPRRDTRLRLLGAAERLLGRGDASLVTADAIAGEAGVAHGTFYRYFRDRNEALEALAQHLRATGAFASDDLLRDDVGTRNEARDAIRTWILERLRVTLERRPFVRAWHTLVASDARLAAYRLEKRESMLRRLREHLTALDERGFAQIAQPAATAVALVSLFEGLIRATILESDSLDEATVLAAADIVERAIFARPD